MIKAAQHRRLIAIGLVLAAALAALGYRLVDLQVIRHEQLTVRARRNTAAAIVREPMRGQIRDRRGNPLAVSVPAKIVCADPEMIGNRYVQVAQLLAPLLQTNENYLIERLQPRFNILEGKTNPVRFVVLKKKVPMETWEQIEQAMNMFEAAPAGKKLSRAEKLFLSGLRRKAIFSGEDHIRVYPNQHLAAHVLGFVANDELQTGQNGIELAFNGKLSGVRGWRRTEWDSKRRELVPFRDQDVEPRTGMNVVLTLDIGLQHILETELMEGMKRHSPAAISGVIVRPRTGEILAMATLPTFDPNRPGAAPIDWMRNRVIADVAEPGSTFKIVVVSAALNEGLISLTDLIDCENGRFHYAGRVLRDAHGEGTLSVESIITKSSNIGAAKVGLKLGENALHRYIRDFGFGLPTGVPLPGEVRGIVHPVKDWSKVSIAQIPMGHGIAVTPLQMVMAMSAIANRGQLMRPMLVDRLEDEDGRMVAKYQPQMVRQAVNERTARDMVSALKTVVTSDGTAIKAKMENYTVAGKTGTAQKVINGTYSSERFYASFIGFFPADNAELCISIVLDDPKGSHYGGQTGAPVFKGIAERAANYLGLRPDIIVPPQTLAAFPEPEPATIQR